MTMHRARPVSGFTLMEVMISMGIGATVLAILVETMSGANNYAALGSAQDELVLDARNVFNEIGADLSSSGWYFPTAGGPYSGVTFSGAGGDRGLRYFPCVVQQPKGASIGGVSAAFPELQRTSSYIDFTKLLVGDAPGTIADASKSPSAFVTTKEYRSSFYARSQELVFLRSTVNSWDSVSDVPIVTAGKRPSEIQRPILNFKRGSTSDWETPNNHALLGVLHPSGWKESLLGLGDWTPWDPAKPYGAVLEGARLDTQSASGGVGVVLQWEEMGQTSFTAQTDSNLRVFTYAVVPTPNGVGFGRLVRAYVANSVAPVMGSEIGQAIAINGTSAVIVDQVLANNVVRVVFETARHDATLQVNQVRVILYLAKKSEANEVVVKTMVEATLTMRARNSEVDQGLDLPNIGTPIPFTY